jgi:predicted aminopeptidase
MEAGNWWAGPCARCVRQSIRVRWLIGSMSGIAAAALVVCLISGCAAMDAVDYYWQSAAGEWDLLSRARPIQDVIAETDDASLKTRLKQIAEMRKFASRELGLPSNGSYTRYTDLGRPFVSWTVFATPRLSLAPLRWCFPIAGCVGYRGYFTEVQAKDEAARLQAGGDDVYIGRVPAFSTLGYFDDPILSSFVRWPETDVARLIFHELAHQLLYVPGDTEFNESYAVTVESAGLQRWLAHEHKPELWTQFERSERTRAEFDALVRKTHTRLAAIYVSSATEAEKQTLKLGAFSDLRRAYDLARSRDPGFAGYEQWFSQHLNNAKLAAVAFYTDRVPAFRAILHEEDGDLLRFYARVRQLGNMPKGQRKRILDHYQALDRTRSEPLQQAIDRGPSIAAAGVNVDSHPTREPSEVRR